MMNNLHDTNRTDAGHDDHEPGDSNTGAPTENQSGTTGEPSDIVDEITPEKIAGARRERFSALDIDNATRFVEEHSNRVLYDHTFSTWCYYDGVRWRRDRLGVVMELVKETAERVYDDATATGDRELLRQAKSFRNYNGLRNALVVASTMKTVAVSAEDFDTDAMLFNTPSGTIDLRTRKEREHRPEDRITMVSGCPYVEGQQPEFFNALVKTYFPDSENDSAEIISFLFETLGYCLSGRNTEKLFVLLVGAGDTGKTTFMRGVEMVWGDYFRAADWTSFAEQRNNDGNRHRTDLARLVGARIVSVSEGEEGCRMSDGVIKRVTGGSVLTIRDLHSQPFECRPTWKIWFDSNHAPRFKGSDGAMWLRVKRVPFRHQITLDMQRKLRADYGDIEQRLSDDAPGILNMVLKGWKAYDERGQVKVPSAIEMETQAYREQEDAIGAFLRERCELAPHESVDQAEVYRQYLDWAKEQGENYPLSARRLNTALTERPELARSKSNGDRLWRGLKVKQTMADRALEAARRLAADAADRDKRA